MWLLFVFGLCGLCIIATLINTTGELFEQSQDFLNEDD